ncbi:unnamed protein product [Larinioides sclopetarius]|uniref:C2H2-type domain-containing protein n=1 Tax=Larinioides sclopetarius TaxID=280406 RepID=A0AAV2BG33_9ARAC
MEASVATSGKDLIRDVYIYASDTATKEQAPVSMVNEFVTCDVCNKQFSQKCDLIKHFRSHTNKKPYSCDV